MGNNNAVGWIALLLLVAGAAALFARGEQWDRLATEALARHHLSAMREDVAAALKAGEPLGILADAPALWAVRLDAKMPHPPSSAVSLRPGAAPLDAGYWTFDSAAGRLYIDCTHTDSRGTVWTSY